MSGRISTMISAMILIPLKPVGRKEHCQAEGDIMLMSCSIDLKCSRCEEKSIFFPWFSEEFISSITFILSSSCSKISKPCIWNTVSGCGDSNWHWMFSPVSDIRSPSITDLILKSLLVLQLVSSSSLITSYCLCDRWFVVLTLNVTFFSPRVSWCLIALPTHLWSGVHIHSRIVWGSLVFLMVNRSPIWTVWWFRNFGFTLSCADLAFMGSYSLILIKTYPITTYNFYYFVFCISLV